MATYDFGIEAITGTGSTWLVQSVNNNYNAEEAIARDNQGEPVDAHYYGKTDEATYEAIVPHGEDTPEVGMTVKIEGINYYVTSKARNRSNTDYTKWTINVKHFVANNLPADDSSSGA